MLLFISVVATTAVLMFIWGRVPGSRRPQLESMSESWMAEHRSARR